ncbi:MAG: sodium:proton antiporter [Candidatus Kapabacteria bacterium]|nr:sodium:proton antiporter [Ignavibacteriota bacterium]MCW5884916.1 sodium:proton antiporter [Candidatus Kapabacteria bacterium]
MEHTYSLPAYSMLPFVLMLAAIAAMPVFANHFWESNRNKLIVSLALAIPTSIYLIFVGYSDQIEHILLFDYIPFIILLGSLFVITGGIHIKGDIEATPKNNMIFLMIGAVLASFMGTTGAAMLLIRPLLQTNYERKLKVHTVLFFIAIVANCGGLLTPLGDPPLFMMYLRGAEFFWFLKLFPEWLTANILLLTVYYFVDKYFYSKELPQDIIFDKTNIKPIRIVGKRNFIFLIGVVIGVAFINEGTVDFIHSNHYFSFLREGFLIVMASLSLYTTGNEIRKANNFSWAPILEVAYLFVGIFLTMIPALEYLKAHANQLGIQTAGQFYYATGILSSFLDNTPTAVTFYYLELGLVAVNPERINGTIVAGIPQEIMIAISTAAVFFGAMTYIGNGPNFMVKAIAEEQGIKMPDFFSYMFKFSLIVLLPILILIQLIFINYNETFSTFFSLINR